MSVGWHEPLQLLKPVEHHDEVLRRGLVATAFSDHEEAPAVGGDIERPPKTRISELTLEDSDRRAAAPRRSGLHPHAHQRAVRRAVEQFLSVFVRTRSGPGIRWIIEKG